jgi:hypothetical protein
MLADIKRIPKIGFARRVGPAFDPRGNLTVIVGFRQRRTPMKLPARDIKIPPISTKTLKSGAARERKALDRLIGDARKRKFDIVLVWRFDLLPYRSKCWLTSSLCFMSVA